VVAKRGEEGDAEGLHVAGFLEFSLIAGPTYSKLAVNRDVLLVSASMPIRRWSNSLEALEGQARLPKMGRPDSLRRHSSSFLLLKNKKQSPTYARLGGVFRFPDHSQSQQHISRAQGPARRLP
jgi:hypothetical protein